MFYVNSYSKENGVKSDNNPNNISYNCLEASKDFFFSCAKIKENKLYLFEKTRISYLYQCNKHVYNFFAFFMCGKQIVFVNVWHYNSLRSFFTLPPYILFVNPYMSTSEDSHKNN